MARALGLRRHYVFKEVEETQEWISSEIERL